MVRVLLLCNDVLGPKMAGPAIRYWELARHLATRHDVVLAARVAPGVTLQQVDVVELGSGTLDEVFARTDVCFTQLVWPSVALLARKYGVRLIVDCYDPLLLEELEAFGAAAPASRRVRNRRTLAKTRLALEAADAVVCANDRQRDLWLGALMAMDRLTPEEYTQDPSLQRLVSLVPFGLPDEAPLRTAPGIRQKLALSPESVVLLWGGGVWNWFDPITLITALAVLVTEHPDLHLVFMGLRHPNERVPEAAMAGAALALATELGLLGTRIHVNADWTPYDERQNNLLDADIGVSMHFDQLETRFAFRTRMLDYLWAGLPIVSTEGDSFADLVRSRDLGAVVPPRDVDALVRALRPLINSPRERERLAGNVRETAKEFAWSVVADALSEVVEHVMSLPAQRPFPRTALARYFGASLREVVVERRAKEVGGRLVTRFLHIR